MTALGVVEDLRNLAADPQNRATIVKVRNLNCIAECPIFSPQASAVQAALIYYHNDFLIFYRIKVAQPDWSYFLTTKMSTQFLQPWRFVNRLIISSNWKDCVPQICIIFFLIQALKFLSEFPPNRSKMREEIGMVISLKTIMHKEGYNPKARQMAKEVYQNIIPPINTTSSKRIR